MRIRVTRDPRPVDGVDLSMYREGCEYDVDPLIVALMVCEGWAVPLDQYTNGSPPPRPPRIYRK